MEKRQEYMNGQLTSPPPTSGFPSGLLFLNIIIFAFYSPLFLIISAAASWSGIGFPNPGRVRSHLLSSLQLPASSQGRKEPQVRRGKLKMSPSHDANAQTALDMGNARESISIDIPAVCAFLHRTYSIATMVYYKQASRRWK